MINAHRGAFEYDWRARFHLPLAVVGKSMTWGETFRLVMVLVGDPASAVAASLAGWATPLSREAIVLMDLFDMQHSSKVKKRPQPYPRPWPTERTKLKHGDAGDRTPEQVKAILREQFGQPEIDLGEHELGQ